MFCFQVCFNAHIHNESIAKRNLNVMKILNRMKWILKYKTSFSLNIYTCQFTIISSILLYIYFLLIQVKSASACFRTSPKRFSFPNPPLAKHFSFHSPLTTTSTFIHLINKQGRQLKKFSAYIIHLALHSYRNIIIIIISSNFSFISSIIYFILLSIYMT